MSDNEVLDESWETTSGLPLAGGTEVTITDMVFGFNPKIGDGLTLCANITFQIDETGDTTEQSFSTGQNWEAKDKGARAEKNGGVGKQSFSKQSNFGRLIDSAVAVGAGSALAGRGAAYVADTWIGTQWATDTTPITTTNPSTGKEQTKDAVVFSEFRGVGEEGAAPAKAAGATKKAASKPAPAGLDEALEAQLVELAGQHDTHDDFMAAALELDEVAGSKDATNAVMESGKGSIWARALAAG